MRFRLILGTFLLFLSASLSFSQTISFNLGIDGLTCSQCSKSVEMQLKRLDFVKSVEMELASTSAIIKVNEASVLSPDEIAKAVRNAGFSVRYLKLSTSAEIKPCMLIDGFDGMFSLQNVKNDNSQTKATSIIFLGSSFQSKKELKQNKYNLTNLCSDNNGKVYFARVEYSNSQ